MSGLDAGSRRPMLLSRRWLQVALFVFVLGFFGLGLAGRFQVVIGGDSLPVRKPDPATPNGAGGLGVMRGRSPGPDTSRATVVLPVPPFPLRMTTCFTIGCLSVNG